MPHRGSTNETKSGRELETIITSRQYSMHSFHNLVFLYQDHFELS